MKGRRFYYLLTVLPPLPSVGGALPITMAEALALLRQQGEGLEPLTDAFETEQPLRDALDEWVSNPPGSRALPAAIPPPLASLFDEAAIAGSTEDAWVDAVWQAWLDLLAGAGRRVGSALLPRWTAWEAALRRRLAGRRRGQREERVSSGGQEEDGDGFRQDAILAEWTAARSRGGGLGLAAAMQAEETLDERRLDFLDEESPRYTFTVDEVVAYLLKLRLLERWQRLDPEKGRALVSQVATL